MAWKHMIVTDILTQSVEKISYADFIDDELIHFSKYDCDRYS